MFVMDSGPWLPLTPPPYTGPHLKPWTASFQSSTPRAFISFSIATIPDLPLDLFTRGLSSDGIPTVYRSLLTEPGPWKAIESDDIGREPDTDWRVLTAGRTGLDR